MNVVKAVNENESLVTAVDRFRVQIDAKSECLVALSVQVQKWSAAVKTQVEEICQKKGVNSFILDIQSDAEVFEAMEQLKKLGALVRILPENRNIISLLEKQFNSLQAGDAYLKARPAQVSVCWSDKKYCAVISCFNCFDVLKMTSFCTEMSSVRTLILKPSSELNCCDQSLLSF